ncbi:hypothetical protein [Ascidiaceihabitans sp.]|uniref:hypothetical protein n=1 Tax=Ascidiaceihabitans sp. TaxID=1872644 RepID=UPI00329979A3
MDIVQKSGPRKNNTSYFCRPSVVASFPPHPADAAVHNSLTLAHQNLHRCFLALDPKVQFGKPAQLQFIREPEPCGV